MIIAVLLVVGAVWVTLAFATAIADYCDQVMWKD